MRKVKGSEGIAEGIKWDLDYGWFGCVVYKGEREREAVIIGR